MTVKLKRQHLLLILKIILILAILFNLSFIFIQSSLSPAASTERSDSVTDAVTEKLPSDSSFTSYVVKYIRKLAHFIEFFTLGALVGIFVALFYPTLRSWLISAVGAVFVALIDETIQIFSNRVPSVTDVWIDTSGFLTSLVLCALISLLVRKLREVRSRKVAQNSAQNAAR